MDQFLKMIIEIIECLPEERISLTALALTFTHLTNTPLQALC